MLILCWFLPGSHLWLKLAAQLGWLGLSPLDLCLSFQVASYSVVSGFLEGSFNVQVLLTLCDAPLATANDTAKLTVAV